MVEAKVWGVMVRSEGASVVASGESDSRRLEGMLIGRRGLEFEVNLHFAADAGFGGVD
jgi:hypothetical protein